MQASVGISSNSYIQQLLDDHAWRQAVSVLEELWQKQPTLTNAHLILSAYEQLGDRVSLTKCRLAILRSFTVEPLLPLVRAAALTHGIDLAIHLGDFNAYAQEILDGKNRLYEFDPEIVILTIQTRDLVPALWISFADLSVEQINTEVYAAIAAYQSYVQAFRAHSQAHLVIHTLELPVHSSQGILDAQNPTCQVEAIRDINLGLRQIAQSNSGVYLLDYDALVARHGRLDWHDEIKWLTTRMPISARCLVHVANEWMRFIAPLTGRSCKVLVTDLDNTLWGGVIGEDGMDSLEVGSEYPGAAYHALQRVMLDLYQRGILLAICSKNNFADAMEVLEKHPAMLLRPAHFAAIRINWNDKTQSLREIAQELNVGLDSIAFLDDSPVERAHVCSELPQVTVIELPDAPMRFADMLRAAIVFERLGMTDEDRVRTRYYVEQRERRAFETNITSVEEFYRSLNMQVEIARVTPITTSRVAQLTQKTNQFNLTTHRYSEQQVANLLSDSNWQVFSLRARDRFGDHGLVGVAILHYDGTTCEIDTLLLSCRVIGRTIETAFLSYLVSQAQSRGVARLQGCFLPTAKNVLVKDFYLTHGFQLLRSDEAGSVWELDLAQNTICVPDWIQINDGAKSNVSSE